MRGKLIYLGVGRAIQNSISKNDKRETRKNHRQCSFIVELYELSFKGSKIILSQGDYKHVVCVFIVRLHPSDTLTI